MHICIYEMVDISDESIRNYSSNISSWPANLHFAWFSTCGSTTSCIIDLHTFYTKLFWIGRMEKPQCHNDKTQTMSIYLTPASNTVDWNLTKTSWYSNV